MMRRTLVWMVGGCLFLTGNRMIAASSDNPYLKIVDRNIFGLRPPTPAVDPGAIKPPTPKITLTGISTLLETKQVLGRIALPARPPEPAHEESFMLAEGQRVDQLEVLEINEKTGDVKVNNFGTVMTLNLDKDSSKPSSTPIPVLPTSVPVLNSPIPPPAAMTKPTNPNLPPRTLRLPPGAHNPGGGNQNASSISSGGNSGANGQSGELPPLTPEQQVLMIEAQRAKALDEGDATASKILPNTPLTSEVTGQPETPLPQ